MRPDIKFAIQEEEEIIVESEELDEILFGNIQIEFQNNSPLGEF